MASPRPLPPALAAGDADIFGHPLPGDEAGVLEQHPHRGRQAGEGLAVEQQLAAIGHVEASQQPQEGALAAARAADDRHELAGCDVEVEPVQDLPLTEALGNAGELHLEPAAGRRAGNCLTLAQQCRGRPAREGQGSTHAVAPAVW